MALEIRMPQLGMNMTEGTIVSWLVPDGAKVKKGDAIVQYETDKVTASIEAPGDGIVQRVAGEKETVPVLELVAVLLTEGESYVPPGADQARGVAADTVVMAERSSNTPPTTETIRCSPIARRLAAEHGIELSSIVGSGPGGRIIEADVSALIQPAQTSPRPSGQNILERIPMSGRRKLIAERMMASLADSAQLTITREVDATELVQFREALLGRTDEFGIRVPYDALLAKCVATALTEQPTLNAVVESDAIVVFDEVNIAVAVASADGLITPVVRKAEALSLIDVAEKISDFARRASENSLLPDELTGGTVTITNLGMYGVDSFTPILNPPQSAILGIGRIIPRPAVVGSKLTVQPTLYLSLTWDHRVADGAQAAQLLGRIVELLGDRAYLSSLA